MAKKSAKASKKSDKALRERIERLAGKGVSFPGFIPDLEQGPVVNDLLEVVGDLTLYQVIRLVEIALADHDDRELEALERARANSPRPSRGPSSYILNLAHRRHWLLQDTSEAWRRDAQRPKQPETAP
jgi:hypothetical protein